MDFLNEEWLHSAVELLMRVVEAAGALVIFCGAAYGFALFVYAAARSRGFATFDHVRLVIGRFLALGLELQLGADLLRTAVAPTWKQIGQLAAIAAIRTALDYFLGLELREEARHPPLPPTRRETNAPSPSVATPRATPEAERPATPH